MVGGEGVEDGVTHDGSLVAQELAQAKVAEGFLLAAEEAVKPDAEHPTADEDAAKFTPRHAVDPTERVVREDIAQDEERDSNTDKQQAGEDELETVKLSEKVAHCLNSNRIRRF